jgi:outer membrane lipoprotein
MLHSALRYFIAFSKKGGFIVNAIQVVFVLFVFFQGCTYAISPSMVEKSDKTISFEMLRTDPTMYKGRLVIFGGVIAQTSNLKQGTLITVSQKPLDYWGKPVRTNKTGGQFFVFSPRYLDSLTYDAGREITVAAEVAGTSLKALGEGEFDQPMLISKELKLWPRELGKAGAQTQWGDPLYDPQRLP